MSQPTLKQCLIMVPHYEDLVERSTTFNMKVERKKMLLYWNTELLKYLN
jgi:hypothetical protein